MPGPNGMSLGYWLLVDGVAMMVTQQHMTDSFFLVSVFAYILQLFTVFLPATILVCHPPSSNYRLFLHVPL